MKKLITLIFIISFFSFFTVSKAKAQGHELKYNRVLIVGGSEQTVPPDAVWKVTSIYGEEANGCIEIKCKEVGRFAKATFTSIFVDGILIPSTVKGFTTSDVLTFNNPECTTGASWYSNASCANKDSDPNILPMWLPAGTKLKSGGPNTFVSVMEFLEQ